MGGVARSVDIHRLWMTLLMPPARHRWLVARCPGERSVAAADRQDLAAVGCGPTASSGVDGDPSFTPSVAGAALTVTVTVEMPGIA
jgi:hypothetical protein